MMMSWLLFLLLHSLLLPYFTLGWHKSHYDYSATTECLRNPGEAQYRGGVVQNPEMERGLSPWRRHGDAEIEWRQQGSNNFIVAKSRRNPHDGFSQKLYLKKNIYYTFSAWIQLSAGSGVVQAVFHTREGKVVAGSVIAKAGCWSMLKGGLSVDHSSNSKLYFLCNNTETEIWGDSISLQGFTKKEWISHQQSSIEKVRKSRVKVRATDAKGNPLVGATVRMDQTSHAFPFGVAINRNILSNNAYAQWIGSRSFTVTTFENEMKWYTNEAEEGQEDYSEADEMIAFARQHNIQVRGHNVFWDDPIYQPQWVPNLSPSALQNAVATRINSIMTKYQNQVIGWDVVNENMHFSFFEDKLGKYVSGALYERALELDSQTTMFLNEFNVIESSGDSNASASSYAAKLTQIRGYGNNIVGKFGIGIEGHFTSKPNIPYIRSVLETLSQQNADIWITELDFKGGPNQDQAGYLREMLEELYSNPAVKGIVVWSAWDSRGCYRMCLTDNNFKNLDTGNVVDDFLAMLTHAGGVEGKTDEEGMLELSLFHGDYDIVVSHSLLNYTMSHSLKVVADTIHHVDMGAHN